ncbi:F-box protein At1g61340-like [Phoenix dactylifera]|uniref:F-box protein At1g61340-like n=1 Tax=Phoenix dactylifera TaxID=42345 RepID=A0A8B8JB10_PHODC|nr:F-box protein At1g61340-like [Phoenix dactylifera]XP_026665149.2 F-box protein At1g61340-like [Phoenix dactylifera]
MAVGQAQHEGSLATGLEFVPRTRILGRKRVVISSNLDASNLSSRLSGPLQRKHGTRYHMERSNRLELLPQDVVVRILCKVNHSDLKQLLLVSKFVHGATLIAKEMHFAFSTPSSRPLFGRGRHTGDTDPEVSEEAPNAPKQQRVARSRFDEKTLSSIAVALFTSQNGLVADM